MAPIEPISTNNNALDDYLNANVLEGLEPDLLDFLPATCVTTRI